MKTIRLTMACLLLVMLGTGSAWADRGNHGQGHHDRGHRAHLGIVIGPLWGPLYPPRPYYYPPYSPYYYPPVVVERPAPPVYIEQPQVFPAPPVPAAETINYWYYCAEANGYYPYVKECRSGWQRVLPQPPGQP
ncbi:MAG: hypothetical protein WAZ34_10015 [Rhodocyclaceae bacterium]